MTQSPVFPAVMPNLEFIEHYLDSLENLPLDVQRHVTQIREYDYLYSNKLQTISRYLCLYQKETNGPSKRKYLNKIQKCLIRSQQYADEKLCLISQIVELVDSRSQQLSKDVETMSLDRKEEESRNSNNINNQNRVKIEKKTIVEKPVTRESLYVKPKRVRRVRVMDKISEKSDRLNNRGINRQEYDDEDEPMEEEEEDIEVKPRKESKKKERDSKPTRDKEKEKETAIKEEKEERKEENSKKNDRKEKSSSKVTKKTSNTKQTNSKVKKKKKKEKEVLPEDLPVDPDEPTYCICNRISYGDMIGCDNQDCKIEWFHFDCVNLTHKPKGKWYCPQCTIERKEKGKK